MTTTNHIDAIAALFTPDEHGPDAFDLVEILMNNDKDKIKSALRLTDDEITDLYTRYDCCPMHECDFDTCADEDRADCAALRS